jgi:hypothetical protein
VADDIPHETIEDDGRPFREVDVQLPCPHPGHGEQTFLVKLGWVNRAFPMVHIEAKEMIDHINAEHKGNM